MPKRTMPRLKMSGGQLAGILVAAALMVAGCNGGSASGSAPGAPYPRALAQKVSGGEAPTRVTVQVGNGRATVHWSSPSSGPAVLAYRVTLTPTYNDRLPAPNLGPYGGAVSRTVGPTVRSWHFAGLLEDCHQRYHVTVSTLTATGLTGSVTSRSFRPSGIVPSSGSPPYVVILLDGVAESQPTFTVNPYLPTTDGVPSYCPESWNSALGDEQEADFAGAPNGPWSFFHKWNVGEIDNPLPPQPFVSVSDGQPAGSNPDNSQPNTESLPRAVAGNTQGLVPGTYTHSFMLDALAGSGAIIIPYSYKGFGFDSNFKSRPAFTFYGYTSCQSLPGCGPTIQEDANLLDSEVRAASQVWPFSKIIVMGHSQGGLIAYEWWMCSQGSSLPEGIRNKVCQGLETSLPPKFWRGFSLDSPINGACAETPIISFGCGGPPSYPPYEQRASFDPIVLSVDDSQGDPFRFIGSYGDSPAGGYQSGAKTLEHQLLYDYNTYSDSQTESRCGEPSAESGCPIGKPDHLSECPVDQTLPWETAHYVEKFCPGDVKFFDDSLHLSYFPAAPPSPQPSSMVTPSQSTALLTFNPWVATQPSGVDVPSPDLVITDGGTANCTLGSLDDPGRESAANCESGVCFVNVESGDPGSPVLCSSDPTSKQVTQITPSPPFGPNQSFNKDDPSKPPWYLVLADGKKCAFQGYGTNADVLNYWCGGNVGATAPDRSKPTWTVQEGSETQPERMPTGVPVAVVTAYR